MTLVDAIETAGAVLTTLCWLPQVVKVVFGKDTRSISLPTFLVLAAGIVCWIVYGIALDNLPLIGANAVSLAFVLVIWPPSFATDSAGRRLTRRGLPAFGETETVVRSGTRYCCTITLVPTATRS
jgi:MtN3 and saliva related transmembrane protein